MYACAYVNVHVYVCHEGFGTSGSLSGRRISVIDGTAASLVGGRDPTTSRGDTDGVMLPEMLTGPNQAGLGRIDATRRIMYVVNSESRFRVSYVPITRGSREYSLVLE